MACFTDSLYDPSTDSPWLAGAGAEAAGTISLTDILSALVIFSTGIRAYSSIFLISMGMASTGTSGITGPGFMRDAELIAKGGAASYLGPSTPFFPIILPSLKPGQ